jgi:hypothetical protein
MLPDLARGLGIDFAAWQRGESVADIHHGVTAFALPVVDPEAEAFGRASFLSSVMKRSRLSLCRADFSETNIGQFCPDIKWVGQKVWSRQRHSP